MTFESIFELMTDEKFENIITNDALENWFEDALVGAEAAT